jgi:hypothetical protein
MKRKAIDVDALIAETVPPIENPQLAFTIPVRVVSEANQSEHWRTKCKRKKQQQGAVWEEWLDVRHVPICLPCTVRLTRIGPKRMDSDNLAGSFKHVQDQVARELGIDDGSRHIKWEYAQVAVGKRHYAVRVEVY